MALSDLTYSSLQSALTDWSARPDLTAAQLQDCILMFEAEANRRLRVRQQLTAATVTTVSGVGTLPSDYLAFKQVSWAGDPYIDLTHASEVWLKAKYGSAPEDVPAYFGIRGTEIFSVPYTDTSNLILVYFAKVPALSSTNTTNWLLTAHPDLYLAGSLFYLYSFVMDAAHAQGAKDFMNACFDGVERLDMQSDPAPLQIYGHTP